MTLRPVRSLPVTSSCYVLVVADLTLIAASEVNVSVKTIAEPLSTGSDKPRTHVCAACQRSFARLEQLSRHERTHTQEKPFECAALQPPGSAATPSAEAIPDDDAVPPSKLP